MEKKRNVLARGQITLTTVSDGEGIVMFINGGVRGISYAADGAYPDPATSPPFFVEVIKNGVKVIPYSYKWSCGGNVSGSSEEPTFTPEISPSYISGNSYVRVDIQESKTSSVYSQTIPIVSTKFADGLDWIQEWNGTATLVNDHKVITPRIFAGENKGTNKAPVLNGVAIGLDILGSTKKSIGIIGYNENDPRFKLDIDGNFFVGSGWGDISSGVGGGIKYDATQKKLTVSGTVEIKSGTILNQDVDKVIGDLESNSNTIDGWKVTEDDGTVTINGGAISAKTISADKIIINGLTVVDTAGKPTLTIAQNGEVTMDGVLRSSNFNILNKTGYQITRDGKAIFNQAIIRGVVELPNAGITNEGEGDSSIRFWAGQDYENRELAPFKVLQNGSLIAFDGTFNGKLYGDYDNSYVHIRGNSIYLDSIETTYNRELLKITNHITTKAGPIRYIQLSPTQSIINTNLYIGDRDFEYVQNSKQIITKTKNIGRTAIGTTSMNYETQSEYHILNTSGGKNGSHDIRYEEASGGLVLESRGSNTSDSRSFDYKFKKSQGEAIVSIEGALDIERGITSPKHNIEMRATKTGFAFYLV